MQVRGIQNREPYIGSRKGYSAYNHQVLCDEFIIKRETYGQVVEVKIFFPRKSTPQQGIGLILPSLEVAKVVGQALTTVGESYTSEMGGKFL